MDSSSAGREGVHPHHFHPLVSLIEPASTSSASSPIEPNSVSISYLIGLKEEEVLSLPKAKLRQYFLLLQEHVRNPREVPRAYSAAPLGLPSLREQQSVSPLLRLPREIRDKIYRHLLTPTNTPVKGPHPRQLQSEISLSQSFHPQILRTNRLLYSEAIAIFYGNPSQYVHIKIDYNVWSHRKQRSDLHMSSQTKAAMRNFHVMIDLGNEKRLRKPEKEESDARLEVIMKGVRKFGKWVFGIDISTLRVSWNEPPLTYTWQQKKAILDELRLIKPQKVQVGEINWGLTYPGERFRFREDYLETLERPSTVLPGPSNVPLKRKLEPSLSP